MNTVRIHRPCNPGYALYKWCKNLARRYSPSSTIVKELNIDRSLLSKRDDDHIPFKDDSVIQYMREAIFVRDELIVALYRCRLLMWWHVSRAADGIDVFTFKGAIDSGAHMTEYMSIQAAQKDSFVVAFSDGSRCCYVNRFTFAYKDDTSVGADCACGSGKGYVEMRDDGFDLDYISCAPHSDIVYISGAMGQRARHSTMCIMRLSRFASETGFSLTPVNKMSAVAPYNGGRMNIAKRDTVRIRSWWNTFARRERLPCEMMYMVWTDGIGQNSQSFIPLAYTCNQISPLIGAVWEMDERVYIKIIVCDLTGQSISPPIYVNQQTDGEFHGLVMNRKSRLFVFLSQPADSEPDFSYDHDKGDTPSPTPSAEHVESSEDEERNGGGEEDEEEEDEEKEKEDGSHAEEEEQPN